MFWVPYSHKTYFFSFRLDLDIFYIDNICSLHHHEAGTFLDVLTRSKYQLILVIPSAKNSLTLEEDKALHRGRIYQTNKKHILRTAPAILRINLFWYVTWFDVPTIFFFLRLYITFWMTHVIFPRVRNFNENTFAEENTRFNFNIHSLNKRLFLFEQKIRQYKKN